VTGSKKDVQTTLLGRTINRRRLIQTAAVAGAGAAASSVFTAPAVLGQAKGKVTFWTTYSDVGLKALQQIAQTFNGQSTKTEVTVVQRPPASVTDSSSLITAVRGGEGPDVYLLDRFIVAERASTGLLQDLTDLMKAAGDDPDLKTRYVGFAAAEATYDGKPYALPFDTDVRMLFYNKKMLTDAGVDLEAWDPKNGPMVFDDVKAIANKLNKEESGNFSQVGFVPYFAEGWHYTYGFDWGGNFFDYDKCQVTPDDPKILEASQWVYDYAKELNADKLYAFIQNAIRVGAAPTDNPFMQNRLAMFISGNWMFQQFRTYIPKVEVGHTYIPVPTKGMNSTTWAGGWSGVIPQGAKNPEGGYEFVRYLCGAEGLKAYVKLNNNLPTIKELLTDKSLFDANLTWVVDSLFPTTRNRPPLPVGSKYWDELGNAWQAIYLNQADPKTAMETAKKDTQQQLDSGGFCPVAKPS